MWQINKQINSNINILVILAKQNLFRINLKLKHLKKLLKMFFTPKSFQYRSGIKEEEGERTVKIR